MFVPLIMKPQKYIKQARFKICLSTPFQQIATFSVIFKYNS